MLPPSLFQRLFMACLLVLLAVLALEWAASILERIWPTLAVAAGVVILGVGLVSLIRWQRNRW